MVETGIAGEAWVELDSGSILPIDAPAEMLELLDEGVSVLVDLDHSGRAIPWSTVVVTHTTPEWEALASSAPKAAPVTGKSRRRDLDPSRTVGHGPDHAGAGVAAA